MKNYDNERAQQLLQFVADDGMLVKPGDIYIGIFLDIIGICDKGFFAELSFQTHCPNKKISNGLEKSPHFLLMEEAFKGLVDSFKNNFDTLSMFIDEPQEKFQA